MFFLTPGREAICFTPVKLCTSTPVSFQGGEQKIGEPFLNCLPIYDSLLDIILLGHNIERYPRHPCEVYSC